MSAKTFSEALENISKARTEFIKFKVRFWDEHDFSTYVNNLKGMQVGRSGYTQHPISGPEYLPKFLNITGYFSYGLEKTFQGMSAKGCNIRWITRPFTERNLKERKKKIGL